jgi:hypothetical protein
VFLDNYIKEITIMYIITKKQTRQDTNVEFFDIRDTDLVTKEYRDYWRVMYVATNKSQFVQHTLSSDQLELTSISMWDSKESYNEFIADQTALDEFLHKYTAYNTTNNIITTLVSEEEV